MLIDISKWNGDINFSKVKASGVDGIIIRATVGQTGVDTKFYTNIDKALAAGLNVGVYCYSKATSADGAKAEANHTLLVLKNYVGKLYYPVFIDSEQSNTANYAKTTVQAFVDTINADGRFKAGVYCSSSWFKTYIKSVSGNYTKWIAQWSSTQPSCDIWQYSSKGKVNGISGDVDLDKVISYTPTPTPKPSGGIEVTTRVIYYRKGNLMKGQDVKSVQAIVGATQDGTCGAKTDKAIRAYQKANGLKVDGMFGNACWQYACSAR